MSLSPPEPFTGGLRPAPFRLPANSRIGRVRVAVADLHRSAEFYTTVIGLRVLPAEARHPGLVQLGAHGSSQVLLELQAAPGGGKFRHGARLGLYHPAFLLPSRESLGSFVQHLRALGVSFAASDHLYSEALYLTDPDGFTVEVYADRPRETWTFEGSELVSGVYPLDLAKLPPVAPGSWHGAPSGARVGHVHFFVGDLGVAETFYHRGLGLDRMTWRYPGALFLAAGGYHHHVGLNTWAAGAPLAQPEEPRLLFWELLLPQPGEVEAALFSLTRQGFSSQPSEDAVASVTDPWGITVRLLAAS